MSKKFEDHLKEEEMKFRVGVSETEKRTLILRKWRTRQMLKFSGAVVAVAKKLFGNTGKITDLWESDLEAILPKVYDDVLPIIAETIMISENGFKTYDEAEAFCDRLGLDFINLTVVIIKQNFQGDQKKRQLQTLLENTGLKKLSAGWSEMATATKN